MQKCAQCGLPTVLFVNGVPLCTSCDDKRERGEKPTPERPEKADNKGV